jgi:O-antigen ligase
MFHVSRLDLSQLNFRLLRPTLIVWGILILSGISGWKIESRLPVLVGLTVCLLIGVVLLLRVPELGLLLLIPVSFYLKFEVSTGTNITLNGTILLTTSLIGLWFIRKIGQERALQLTPSPANLPAILLLVVSIISLIIGNSGLVLQAQDAASLPAQLGGWLLLALPIGVMLLVNNVITDLPWLKLILYSFILIGAIYFIGVQFEFSRNLFNRIYDGRSIGPIFRIWLVSLSLGQAIWNKELSSFLRLLFALVALLVIRVGWINYDWIVGWTTPLFAMFVVIWLRSWRWGLAVTLAGVAFYVVRSNVLVSQLWDSTQQYSTVSRTWTWPIMWELIKFNPITGLGPANYYYYTSLYSIVGWYVRFNSHNNYIDIVAQYGFLGLAAFGWLVAVISRVGWRLRLSITDGFSLGYVNGALAGLAATLVSGVMADWFLPFLYNIGMPGFRSAVFAWLFLGGLIAMDHIHGNLVSGDKAKSQ